MPTVLTIGNFDGVHLGHAALVRRARELAGPAAAGGRVVVLSFDPHPLTAIRPEIAPKRLTPFERRAGLLRALGADEVVRLEPTPDFLALEPERFVERLAAEHAPAALVEGDDFRFGRGRSGDVETLRALGRRHGFEVAVLPPVQVALTDQTIVRASSTMVRWLLAHARVRDAALVLGRPHEIAGTVVPGDRRGRTIGFPTANVATDDTLPANGVYAARAVLPDGRTFPAAVNVGARPTFENARPQTEAHLILPGAGPEWRPVDGLPEYGWAIRLRLIAFVRDQARFASLDGLVAQIRRDTQRARALVEEADGLFAPDRGESPEVLKP